MTMVTDQHTDTPTESGAVPRLGYAEVAKEMDRAAAMIEAGNPRAARRCVGSALGRADDAVRALATDCLNALERHPSYRDPRFTFLTMKHADDPDASELIATLHPTRQGRPVEPDRTEADRTEKQRREYQRHAPGAVNSRRTEPRPNRRSRGRRRDGDAAAARYLAERDETPYERARWDDPEQLDYDRAAVPELRGRACVSCNVERSVFDQRRHRDGLCEDCRESGHTGLPTDADPAAWVAALCTHVVATSPSDSAAAARLREEWSRAARGDRHLIAQWVTTWRGRPATGPAARSTHPA